MEPTMTAKNSDPKRTKKAEVVREYGGFGAGAVHGVTFDGARVWLARDGELLAIAPETGEIDRRVEVAADAGTAFDGEHLYQIAGDRILVLRPSDGKVVRSLPAPGKGNDSGLAYADGYLWVGQYRDAVIHQIDAKTGALVKTLRSDRWVTGVSCQDGELWHGVAPEGNAPAELRRLDPDGSIQETLVLPDEIFVSGLEKTKDGFYCGGGPSGTVLLVRAARD